MKDDLVRSQHQHADQHRADTIAFKEQAFKEVYAPRDLLFEKYQARIGGKKGDLTFTSFDGSLAVEIKVADRIAFGPELQAAKAQIAEFIEENAEGINDNARMLLEHAFQMNKSGRIDTQRVLGLRKLQVKGPDGGPHPKWEAAMQAITDAVQMHATSTYLLLKEADERGASGVQGLKWSCPGRKVPARARFRRAVIVSSYRFVSLRPSCSGVTVREAPKMVLWGQLTCRGFGHPTLTDSSDGLWSVERVDGMLIASGNATGLTYPTTPEVRPGDALHPNAEGHATIARHVADGLAVYMARFEGHEGRLEDLHASLIAEGTDLSEPRADNVADTIEYLRSLPAQPVEDSCRDPCGS
ncbi:DUF3164 family protein [Pseudomonas sp. GX19020]|nr:DUF3164 family protein [Pseudomonas sp. GX19020]